MKWRNGVDKLRWAGRNGKERARRGRVGIYINEIGMETSPAYSNFLLFLHNVTFFASGYTPFNAFPSVIGLDVQVPFFITTLLPTPQRKNRTHPRNPGCQAETYSA